MSSWVYLDGNGYVRSTSSVIRTLDEAQVKDSGIVQIIADAPLGLKTCNDVESSLSHQKTSGDGTNIDDYELVSNPQYAPATSGDILFLKMQDGNTLTILKGVSTYLQGLTALSGIVYNDLIKAIKNELDT